MPATTKPRKTRKGRAGGKKSIKVQFAVVGDVTFQIKVTEGTTLKKALAEHLPGGTDKDKVEIRVNNEVVDENYALKQNDIVTIIPKIKGGF